MTVNTMVLKKFILLIFIVSSTNSQILNTFRNIRDWAIHEERIFSLVKIRIARLQAELVELKDYAQDYESTTVRHVSGIKSGKGNNDTEIGRAHIVASNALLVHAMSHRYAAKIPRIQKVLMKEDPGGDALKESVKYFHDPELELESLKSGEYHDNVPSNGDLQDALTSLSTLYEFSKNVTPYEFAAKMSNDTNQPILFNAYHATKLSLTSFYHGMFGNAIDWILYADERTLKYSDDSISRDIVMYLRLYMIKMHNAEMYSSTKSVPVYLNFFMENLNQSVARSAEVDRRRDVFIERFKRNELLDVPPEIGYWVLCQGENLQTEEIKSKLKCYLDYERHSIFALLPLKIEELSISPKILQIYDVLGDNEIRNAIDIVNTKPLLQSTVEDEQDETDAKRKPPGSTSARIKNLEELGYIANKAELITGLASSSFEADFQALEYVPGKYDFVHDLTMDSPNSVDDENKELMEEFGYPFGSIAFCLTSVDEGGYTPFLNARTFATPVKGSAIYWEHMYKNGSIRTDAWGGTECPVIRGLKIILVKQFQSTNQFGKLQCSLNQHK